MGLFDDFFQVVNELKDEASSVVDEFKATATDALKETTDTVGKLTEDGNAIVQGAKDKAGQPIEAIKKLAESKGKIQG
jgi:F0F1-type ATP synthase membrane subunit b/b'